MMLTHVILLILAASTLSVVGEQALVPRILSALGRGVKFMKDEIRQANLDAVFCIRRLAEQLEAYIEFEPEIFADIAPELTRLRDTCHQAADTGTKLVDKSSREYAANVGFLMDRCKKLLWYPTINASKPDDPVPCYDSVYNPQMFDHCFKEISKSESATFNPNKANPCDISSECVKFMGKSRQSGYYLSHQVLYFQLLEQFQCTGKASEVLREELCSSVLRDAKETEKYGYPVTYMDLFFEQIGLCGIFGFKSFNNREWIEVILDKQRPSGCYIDHSPSSYVMCHDEFKKNNHKRVKREEKNLANGCHFHETGVALLALAANLRFEMEKLYENA